MNFTNINDAVGVKALLEQLRVSQAWQEIVNHDVHVQEPESSNDPGTPDQNDPSVIHTGNNVALLLSQLQNPQPAPEYDEHAQSSGWEEPSDFQAEPAELLNPSPPPPQESHLDVKACSYQEALGLISQLGNDPEFIMSITKMRQEQEEIERHLWADREAIHKKFNDKVKVARTKASMIGTGLSKHEANMLQDAYQKDLRKFDHERVLPSWDGLIKKQQAKLESLQVPNMFVSTSAEDTKRQLQIIQVLVGLVGS